MKSIVTGGTGFLGTAISQLCKEGGDEVVAIGRQRADIRNLSSLIEVFKGAERVFHTAGKVGIGADWEEFYSTNVTGTRNVIEACRINKIPHLIYTSSPSVIFDGKSHLGVDESYPYPKKFLSHYSATKRIAEEDVMKANGPNLSTVSLRPHLIWGPGDNSLIPRILDRARKNRLFQIGKGKNKVDVTFVANAARAHLEAAKFLGPNGACSGKTYFISQGEPVVLWDFLKKIIEGANAPKIRGKIPASAAYVVGHAMEWFQTIKPKGYEPLLNRFLVKELSKDHYYDISAAKRDFGYLPWVSTEEGLAILRKV